ncbi:hypothetical protein C4K02_3012 [Pseudomonas synxantha]|nr:hypothetical protein C4K02_3012 [Pseudomonas synxantha]
MAALVKSFLQILCSVWHERIIEVVDHVVVNHWCHVMVSL